MKPIHCLAKDICKINSDHCEEDCDVYNAVEGLFSQGQPENIEKATSLDTLSGFRRKQKARGE